MWGRRVKKTSPPAHSSLCLQLKSTIQPSERLKQNSSSFAPPHTFRFLAFQKRTSLTQNQAPRSRSDSSKRVRTSLVKAMGRYNRNRLFVSYWDDHTDFVAPEVGEVIRRFAAKACGRRDAARAGAALKETLGRSCCRFNSTSSCPTQMKEETDHQNIL